jgi:hypothetical protein
VAKSNRPELDELTPQQRLAIQEGAEAIGKLADFRRRSFDLWMTVARGVATLCTIADRPGTSRKARQNLLRSQGYGSLNASTVSRLLLMAEHETAVRAWRDTLTENKRESWNSPTSICNRCPAVRKAIDEAAKGKPPRKPRTTNQHAEDFKPTDSAEDIAVVIVGMVEQSKAEAIARAILKRLPRSIPSTPLSKSKAKAPNVTAAETKKAELVTELVWETQQTIDPKYPNFKAKTRNGMTYDIGASFDAFGQGMPFAGYSIRFYPPNHKDHKDGKYLKGNIKTAAAAKAFAERHYAQAR